MRIADSHEFLELYRGDKDFRMGIEMLKLRDDLQFASFAPDRLSPTDRARFRARKLAEIGLPDVPERMELLFLPSISLRFAKKETGGIVSFMPTYRRELRKWLPDVVIENPFSWLTVRSYQTYHVTRALGIPLIYYDPGDDIPISWKHRLMALWESPVVRRAAAIITFNDAGASRFVDKYSYPPKRISVIPKPVDVGRFQEAASERLATRRRLGLEDSHLAVGYLGRLTQYKGSAYLHEAAREALTDPDLAHLRFIFVGDTLASAEDRREYELPNTTVTGMVPNSEIPQMLAALDVVVFPDVTRPGAFPTAVAEAMAAGKALVVGVGSSTRFMPLENGIDSLLVEPSSTPAIIDALRMLAAAPDLVERLSRGIAEKSRTTMDYPVVAARWLGIIDAALRM